MSQKNYFSLSRNQRSNRREILKEKKKTMINSIYWSVKNQYTISIDDIILLLLQKIVFSGEREALTQGRVIVTVSHFCKDHKRKQ